VRRLVGTAFAAAALASGCVGQSARQPVSTTPRGELGRDLVQVHADADPCVDFAAFACGSGRLMRANDTLAWRLPALWRFLDELAAGKHSDGSRGTALLRELYVRCKDGGARTAGLADLRAMLDQIASAKDLPELARVLGTLEGLAPPILAQFRLDWDSRKGTNPVVGQMGLTGPELPLGFYAVDHKLVGQQRAHWARLVALTGAISESEVDAAARIDGWLASSRLDKLPKASEGVALVDRSVVERARFPWSAFLEGLGVPRSAPLGPASPGAIERAGDLADLPLADLKSHARVVLVERLAPDLGTPFLEEEQRFHAEIERGVKGVNLSLGDWCVKSTAHALEPQLADAYLSDLAHAPSEETAKRMFELIRFGFKQRLRDAAWMDEDSRSASLAKIDSMGIKFVADAEAPEVGLALIPPGSLLRAHLALSRSRTDGNLAKLGAPPLIDQALIPSFAPGKYFPFRRAVWLSPEIVRPPYVRSGPLNATSFGSLGAVIGHEISHALSPSGRGYDAAGHERETWSKSALVAYAERLTCLRNQFDALDAGPGGGNSGRRTLDENVADLSGVTLALWAMETDLARDQVPSNLWEWRRAFFVAYAQTLCTFGGDDPSELDRMTDPHASPRARINGVVANIPAFADAYECKPGAPEAPRERCAVW
jgi:endothelin-converting enzyme/putative endopeptidase